MSCPECGGWLKKKEYVRKREKHNGVKEVFECKRCGHRVPGREMYS